MPASFVRRIVADRLPHVLTKHLEPVRLPPGPPVADLAPHHRLEPDAPHLCERQLEPLQRGLRPVVREDEPGLEAAEHELVAVEVLDQHRDPRQPPRAHRRQAEQRRLPLRRDTEERVGRIRLVAVLGQPDRLRPEVAPDEDEELRDRRHRDRGAVLAAAAGRRLVRPQRIRVVGVGVELRVCSGHAVEPD